MTYANIRTEILTIANKYSTKNPSWVSCGVTISQLVKGAKVEYNWITCGAYQKDWPDDIPDLDLAVQFAISRLCADKYYYEKLGRKK